MALSFGGSFRSEFEKFSSLRSVEEFRHSVVPFAQFIQQVISDTTHPYRNDVINWKVELFNDERHVLYHHQIEAIRGCLKEIVFSKDKKSGYFFMPTSAGKGHILITLAGCAVADFEVFRLIHNSDPEFLDESTYLLPVFISL